MKIACIGAGKMASILMEKVDGIAGATITAICDVNAGAATEAANAREATAYTNHHELYDNEPVDAVLVAIPPFAYEDQVTEAAKRGIDVFVEKPVALDPTQGRETLAAIENADVVSGSGYVFRYDEITERALELLGDRDIAFLDGRYWSGLLANEWGNEFDRSGGEIVTRATHIYDLVRYVGGDVKQVSAMCSDQTDIPEVDYPDTTAATMRHETGLISTVTSTITSPEWTAELDIVGDGAHLHLDYVTQELTGSVDGAAVHEELPTDRYGEEVAAFIEASRRGDPAAVRADFADGLRTLELNWAVIDAATRESKCDAEPSYT